MKEFIRRRLIDYHDRIVGGLYRWLERAGQRDQQRRPAEVLSRLGACGHGVRICYPYRITGPEHVRFGDNVHIAGNCWIRAEGGLRIGDNTHVSQNLVLYTINHRYEGERLPYDDQFVKKPVTIGRNVWIGMNVCITPGSIIGDGAIIGMGTTVSGEVPPLAIVGGARWRILKYRDPNRYRSLDEAGAYGGINGRPLDSERG